MKKILLFVMLFCAVMMNAQSYGVLVNGTTYFGAEHKGKSGDYDEYNAKVSLAAGDKFVLCNASTGDTWTVPLDPWVESNVFPGVFGRESSGAYYTVNTAGCYDFWIKLLYEKDQLYIGPATNCGSGEAYNPGTGVDDPVDPGCTESYGLLVDGVYVAGTKNDSPMDPSFIEYSVLGVELTKGQLVQVHSVCTDASWVISKYANTSYEFAIENGAYKVSETGTYDFYLKFKMDADELWVSCAGCTETPVVSTTPSVPAQCEDVMIQAFYNESYLPDKAEYGTDLYGDTKWATLLPQAEEMGHYFDLVWLPPSAYGAGMGYHPKQYSNQNSNWGTRAELEALIAAYHNAGARVVADIVINHCEGMSSWCDFHEMDFGEYGKFQPDASWICSNDEVNADWSHGCTEPYHACDCWGTATGNPDDGANWDGARDWSHDMPKVQEMFKAYLKWMRYVMKYDGFRYDKGDGFNNWHHWNYNNASKPYIAFMECYTGNDEIISRIKDAKGDMMALDFQTRWSAIWENGNGNKPNTGIASSNYAACQGSGMLGAGYAKNAITFIDSHDWFLRTDAWSQEFGGYGNSLTPAMKGRLMQANAFILSMPGVPCVFYPHWAKYKEDLKPIIMARKAAGVHSESTVNDEEAENAGYKVTVVGKRGNLILMLGNKVQGDHPASWLAENNYYKMASFYGSNNDSFEIWVSMFDGSDPTKYDPEKQPINPDEPVEPEDPVDPEDPDVPTPIDPTYSNSAPENCTDVMIQAFYWDSCDKVQTGSKTEVYGTTKFSQLTGGWADKNDHSKGRIAEEMGQWFDLVWLPPFSYSTGGTGYLPKQYSNLASDWGSEANVRKLIGMLHKNGAKVIEDIVINHGSGDPTWCTFLEQDFGTYGTFQPTASWICNTDDLNWSDEAKEDAGDCFGKASGNADAGYDGLDDFKGGRDWDHKNVKVQNMCKAYLSWLVNDVYVDGFRYDYVKGFKNGYLADYNATAKPYFSVMEAWSGDVGNVQYHLNEARRTSTAFDFPTKFSAFNDGICNGDYSKLKGSGLLGAGESRYAVTFLDNHDTFLRKNDEGWSNEFMGYNNSMNFPGKIMQCYAFMLSMPGIPCVFYPHWVTFKEDLKKMINARYKTGVHSQSAVNDEAAHDYYKATIYGTNGEIRVLIGPASGYENTPAGYTLAVKGENYGVYYRVNEPRGDKNTSRNPITTAIEDVENEAMPVEKFMKNGILYIRVGDRLFDVIGRTVK